METNYYNEEINCYNHCKGKENICYKYSAKLNTVETNCYTYHDRMKKPWTITLLCGCEKTNCYNLPSRVVKKAFTITTMRELRNHLLQLQ